MVIDELTSTIANWSRNFIRILVYGITESVALDDERLQVPAGNSCFTESLGQGERGEK